MLNVVSFLRVLVHVLSRLYIRYKEENFYYEGSETMEQVAQRSLDAPSLEIFEAGLVGALTIQVYRNMSLEGLGLSDLQGPLQPKSFCENNSVIEEQGLIPKNSVSNPVKS